MVGEAAQNLFKDAQTVLQELIDGNELQAKGVYGFWPANRYGADDIELYTDDARSERLAVLHHLRQQAPKPNDEAPNYCLADFVAAQGTPDYVGGFAVTSGLNIDQILSRYDNDDYAQIMIKALADRLAEAFAEYLHHHVRTSAWGYAAEEALSSEELIKERYQGIRPAPGYPACPEHSEKETLFKLLSAPERTGIELTDSFAMSPAASVSGWYFSHPEARYFGIGKIDKDQLADYAQRKGVDLETAGVLLRPSLDD